ncbi:sulfatase [Candidatus Hydrogenedentota bacterium]
MSITCTRCLSIALPILLVAAVSSTSEAGEPGGASKPNIVLILIDDLGWSDVGYNGNKYYETPNIDRLAGQGMRFTNAYAASQVCSPTRASILTGRHPARHHLTWAITYKKDDTLPAEKKLSDEPWLKLVAPGRLAGLPLEEITIAEELKKAGYATGIVGKWHLGKPPYTPENQGFDFNFGGSYYAGPPSYFYPYKIDVIKDGVKGEFLSDRLGAEAVKFIEANRERPFFLYLSQYAVHSPYQAKPEVIDRYKKKPGAGEYFNPTFAGMVDGMDNCVGRVLVKLDELKLSDNTIVIFMSDNGGLTRSPSMGFHVTSNAPLRGGKTMIYEGGVREPMIVRWPGVAVPGSVCEDLVSTNDFFPTILAMAGLKPDPERALDGVSIVPLLKQEGGSGRDTVYWHSPHYYGGWQTSREKRTWWNTPCAAIREGDFKLIEFFEGRIELYNLRKDIGETRNLIKEIPDKARDLQGKLRNWLDDVDAWMPIPNPKYDPDERGPLGRGPWSLAKSGAKKQQK